MPSMVPPVTVTVTETDERSPLLQNQSSEITPFGSPLPDYQHEPSPATNSKHRLISLDVFRGLTVAVSINLNLTISATVSVIIYLITG